MNFSTSTANFLGATHLTYDARGNKLAQEAPGTLRRDYLSGIELADGAPESIYHPEGRALREGGQWKYEYVIRDHLGNTRIVFRPDVGEDTPTPLTTLAYYPFGMEIGGLSAGGAGYPYQYNGKEFSAGVGWYDYGLRNYDPAIGRWLQVDPQAEKYTSHSGYNYVLNNPLLNIDPNGDTVRVYSETISSTGHIARHSYIRATTKTQDVIIELWGQDPETTSRPTGVPRVDDVESSDQVLGRSNVLEHDVERPEGVPEGDESFEDQLILLGSFFKEHTTSTDSDGKEKNDYVHLPDYQAFGPNSNGYVKALLELAGGSVNLSWRAVAKGDTQVYNEKIKEKGISKLVNKKN
ncbi:RHS repeat-associated core domain-containing protein [Neolewinella lacunae]|uniref:RHS repeat-associated core domain-containing protein n=1 Tax=Neolewinella lacunae TaxID=1517758 RepID=A0A923PKW5_9BACT|nr:RHS repeat-associated core domain-containing protein [Neolewinella lacunae]MBC6993169.1 RHS repeat-associated core domain-containing protein [Neolewinella lacunae]MDN3635026.1 RHS repeat-associated core domain-containing protein [Neolewinella lacunae]